MHADLLRESLYRHIGQTVTVFTESGGLSGSGFTGVLAGVGECVVRLITDIGAAPACPLGSDCAGSFDGGTGYGAGLGGGFGGYGANPGGFGGFGAGYGGGCGCGCGCGCNCGCGGSGCGRSAFGLRGGSWLGSVCDIPIDRIVSFTHNAIS